MVPDASGMVKVRVVPVLIPDSWRASFLVLSTSSANSTEASVKVLLVKVSVPAKVAKVPLVGKVTLVVAVVVKVKLLAPEVAKLPAKVKVPVVQVGAPVAPDTNACPVEPAVLNAYAVPVP